MRIALVNIFKPHEGSGDGITEYTWQLYKKLQHKHTINFFYALDESKRVDVTGRLYVETFFRLAAKKIIEGNYDVVHITNPEIGYFAKKLKKSGVKSKIVVTIHDFVRVVSHVNKGNTGLQRIYDSMISKNMKEAVDYSDYIIFTSLYEMTFAAKHYKNIPPHSIILIGPKDLFLESPLPTKKDKNNFVVGYIGGLVKTRHIEFILKTAEALDGRYTFNIYGTGSEKPTLMDYTKEKKLNNVNFMGFAPEDNILQIYDGFNSFMTCSNVDVASLPIEDALARGLPVIIAKDNIYDKVVRDRVYQAAAPKDAAKILKTLRAKGFPKKKRQSNIKFANSISWANVARKTERVYLNQTMTEHKS